MRVNTALTARTVKKTRLYFGGLDYLSVNPESLPSRAAAAENFIKENGVLCKRKGVTQLVSFESSLYTAYTEGVFCYRLNGVEYTLCYVSHYYKNPLIADYTDNPRGVLAYCTFYRVKADYSYEDLLSAETCGAYKARLKPQKPRMYQCGDSVYFSGMGDYWVLHADDPLRFKRVAEDSATYVPVTTISMENDSVTDTVRASLDDVNRCTLRRINRLVGCGTVDGAAVSADNPAVFALDGKCSKTLPITATVTTTDGSAPVTYELERQNADEEREPCFGDELSGKTLTLGTELLSQLTTLKSGLKTSEPLIMCSGGYIAVEYTGNSYNVFYVADRYTEQNFRGKTPSRYNADDLGKMIINAAAYNSVTEFALPQGFGKVYWINPKAFAPLTAFRTLYKGITATLSTPTNYLYGANPNGSGRVQWGFLYGSGNEYTELKMTLPCAPYVADVSNIELRYSTPYEGGGDWCETVSFGTLYGEKGSRDRLFLAAEEGNKVYFSNSGDFSYFAEYDYVAAGVPNNKITGLMPLSDGSLAVYKEPSDYDANVYICKSYSKEIQSGIFRTSFTLSAGNATEGCVSPDCVCNFAGDFVHLSDKGVFGLVASTNQAYTERIATERSRLINPILKNADKSGALMFCHDNRLYVALNNGDCYVADAAYTFRLSGDMSDAFNYEWWKLTDIKIDCYAHRSDGTLLLGRGTGLFAFGEGYADLEWVQNGVGDLTVADSEVTYNPSLVSPEKCDFLMPYVNSSATTFTGNCYALLADGTLTGEATEVLSVSDNGRVTVTETAYANLRVGETVYIENPSAVMTPYYISDLNPDDLSFELSSNAGVKVTNVSLAVRVFHKLNPKARYFVYDADTENNTFKLKDGEGRILRIAAFNGTAASLILRFCKGRAVNCKWETPPLSFSAAGTAKSLTGISLSSPLLSGGGLTAGYETRNLTERAERRLTAFDFREMDFQRFTFDTAFAGSVNLELKGRRFNYIRFFFGSDTDTACTVSELTVRYKETGTLRGLR